MRSPLRVKLPLAIGVVALLNGLVRADAQEGVEDPASRGVDRVVAPEDGAVDHLDMIWESKVVLYRQRDAH